MQMLSIFSCQIILQYTCLLREASQWSREVIVAHVEDPIYIKVTNGNLQNQDILVMDSSILIETVGGIRAMPHCVMGLFLQQASLLSQMK